MRFENHLFFFLIFVLGGFFSNPTVQTHDRIVGLVQILSVFLLLLVMVGQKCDHHAAIPAKLQTMFLIGN